jgi:hypothetical protein
LLPIVREFSGGMELLNEWSEYHEALEVWRARPGFRVTSLALMRVNGSLSTVRHLIRAVFRKEKAKGELKNQTVFHLIKTFWQFEIVNSWICILDTSRLDKIRKVTWHEE